MTDNTISPSQPAAAVKCDGCRLETSHPELLQTRRKSFRSTKVRLCTACQVDSLKYAQRTNWALFGVPLVLVIIHSVWRGSYDAVWFYLRLITAIIVISPISVLIHELGHVVMAKVMGWYISAVVLGAGRLLWQGRVGDVLLQFRFMQMGGLTWCAPRAGSGWVPLQALMVFAAGPAVNALAAWLGLQVYNLQTDADPGGSNGITVTGLWIFFNLFIAAASLLPYVISVTGVAVGSDGYQMLQALFTPGALRHRYEYARPFLQFAGLRQLGEHERARDVMAEKLRKNPDDVFAVQNMSAAECDVENYQECISQSRRGLEMLTQDFKLDPAIMGANSTLMPAYLEAAFKCNLAYATLRGRTGDSAEAFSLAKAAYEVVPWDPGVQSTYGYALAVTGAPTEGLAILRANQKKLHDQPQRTRMESLEILKEVEDLCACGG